MKSLNTLQGPLACFCFISKTENSENIRLNMLPVQTGELFVPVFEPFTYTSLMLPAPAQLSACTPPFYSFSIIN